MLELTFPGVDLIRGSSADASVGSFRPRILKYSSDVSRRSTMVPSRGLRVQRYVFTLATGRRRRRWFRAESRITYPQVGLATRTDGRRRCWHPTQGYGGCQLRVDDGAGACAHRYVSRRQRIVYDGASTHHRATVDASYQSTTAPTPPRRVAGRRAKRTDRGRQLRVDDGADACAHRYVSRRQRIAYDGASTHHRATNRLPMDDGSRRLRDRPSKGTSRGANG